jgi:hypothetical protein
LSNDHPTPADHRQAAIFAMVEVADYREYVSFQADILVDTVIPHIRRMIAAEDAAMRADARAKIERGN